MSYPKICTLVCSTLFFLLITDAQSNRYALQRQRMVEQQLKSRDINDPEVLQAMLQVKRHLFVPEASRDQAYRDRPLPLVKGQTISQPYIVALMTQLAHLEPEEKVLEIGTGSGYQAAILSRLCRHVYSIEIIDQLAKEARQRLKKLGFANIHIKTGDGFKGWKEHAPYDAIIVTCAPPAIPPPLIAQLAESGRLVVPVGRTWQELIVLTKKSGTIHKERIIPVRFVPMTGSGVQTINPGTQ